MSTATGRQATPGVAQVTDPRAGEAGRGRRRFGRAARRDRRAGRSSAAGRSAAGGRTRRPGRSRKTSSDQGSQNFPARRHRRWPWVVALLLVVALVVGGVYTVFFSPLLAVKSVTFSGADDTLTGQVRSVVDVPVGTPLARVDLDAVALTAQQVPEVARVDVVREWPDTIAVTITPRVPVAVTSANGQLWLLDTDGDPYLTVGTPPPGMVTVQLAAPGRNDPATRAAVQVAMALTPEFRSQVAVLAARTEFDVELTLIDRKKVIWGEPTENAQKMQVLPALLAARDGTEYDISDPTLVTVR